MSASGSNDEGVVYWSRAPVDGAGPRPPRRQFNRNYSNPAGGAPRREPLSNRTNPPARLESRPSRDEEAALPSPLTSSRPEADSRNYAVPTRGLSGRGLDPENDGPDGGAPPRSNSKRKLLLWGAGLAVVGLTVFGTLMALPGRKNDNNKDGGVRSAGDGYNEANQGGGNTNLKNDYNNNDDSNDVTGKIRDVSGHGTTTGGKVNNIYDPNIRHSGKDKGKPIGKGGKVDFTKLKVPTVLPNGRVAVPYTDGWTFSRVSFGNLRFIEYEANKNIPAIEKSVKNALKSGITTFDLSDIYGWYGVDGEGRSNQLFADVLAKNPGMRDQMELVCKFDIRLQGGWYHLDTSKEWITRSVERYLERFNTTYLDVLMLHNPPDDKMDPDEVADTFKEVYDAGKVRMFGVSNYKRQDYLPLKKAMNARNLRLSVSEIETSVLHPEKVFDGDVEYFNKEGMVVLGWGAVGGDPMGGKNLLFNSNGTREKKIVNGLEAKGKELGGEPDEVAMAWLLHNPDVIIPIIGSTKDERIKRQTEGGTALKFGNDDYKEVAQLVEVDEVAIEPGMN